MNGAAAESEETGLAGVLTGTGTTTGTASGIEDENVMASVIEAIETVATVATVIETANGKTAIIGTRGVDVKKTNFWMSVARESVATMAQTLLCQNPLRPLDCLLLHLR